MNPLSREVDRLVCPDGLGNAELLLASLEGPFERGLEGALDPARQIEMRAEPTLEEEDPLEQDHAHVVESVALALELRRGLLCEIGHDVAW